MLVPARTKFRKVRKGKNRGPATSNNTIAFGEFALQSQENERITSRQIEHFNRFAIHAPHTDQATRIQEFSKLHRFCCQISMAADAARTFGPTGCQDCY